MQIDFKERSTLVNQYISQERGAIRLAWILAGAIFLVGIGSGILVYFFAPDDAKLTGSIASGLSTLFSCTPLKDYYGKRNKIDKFTFLRERYDKLAENPKRNKELELEKLETVFWELFGKTVGP